MLRQFAMTAALVLAVSCGTATGQETETTQPVLEGDTAIHDPSLIEVDDVSIVYQTGQEGGVHQGAIRIKTSPDGVTWSDAGAIGKGVPKWIEDEIGVRPRNIWAPSVSQHGDTWYLYYSMSIFGMNTSAIGLMTNADLDPAKPGEGWVDQGMVLKSGLRDDFNAIDPFRVDTNDGRAWLTFGSFWEGIFLTELDPESGKLKDPDAEYINVANRGGAGIEAPSILEHDDDFYLFVSLDQCCRGADSTYRMAVGRADDITGPYLNRQGEPMVEGGVTQLQASMGHYVGPGGQEALVTEEGEVLVYHYYDANDLGTSKLMIAPIRWTEDGWPELDPLP